MDYSKHHICDASQMGKQTRNSFYDKDISSTKKPIQLLHINLSGTTITATIGDKR